MQGQLEPADQRNQDEDELAGKHIAEESQAQRDRLGEQSDELENQVEGHDEGCGDDGRTFDGHFSLMRQR